MVDILTTGGEEVGLVGVEPLSSSRGVWVFVEEVSRGSDLLRKPDARLHVGVCMAFMSQSLMSIIMTLLEDGAPGLGRRVSRIVHGVSSPGGRLDQEGIG